MNNRPKIAIIDPNTLGIGVEGYSPERHAHHDG